MNGAPHTTLTLALLTLLWVSACNITTEPTRINPDPRLDEIIATEDGGQDTSTDAPPDTMSEDVVEDAVEDTVEDVQESTFACTPRCMDGFYCLPSGLCAELATRCEEEGVLCDPNVTSPTTTFICEPVFENTAGYCRRVCDVSDISACGEGNTCLRLDPNEELYACQSSCTDEADCDVLETCVGGIFDYCRSACEPFLDNQCPDGKRCVPNGLERGICQNEGAVPSYGACTLETDCGAGHICLNLGGGGSRCTPYCEPDTSDQGRRCEIGQRCIPLQGIELGVCFDACDLFDQESCADDLGCLALEGAEGACVYRGDTQSGGECSGTGECSGDLQCFGQEGTCERACLRAATAGQPGACPDGMNCASIGDPELGVCQ